MYKQPKQKAAKPTKHNKVHKTTKRAYSKHKRFETIAERVKYIVPQSRVKPAKRHPVVGFRSPDNQVPTLPPVIDSDEARDQIKARQAARVKAYKDHLAGGGAPRVFSLRKQFLYNRNRRILESAHAVLIIQPGSDAEFYEIMDKLIGHWETAHFRNGLVHLDDKSYANLKEFFKGPIRVLLQKDKEKIFPSVAKLRKVLNEHPDTLFLGGAIDGFAGVAKDFEELKQFESKLHIQQQLINTLSGVNALIPTLDYPTKNLAMVMNHHEKEITKQQTDV
eukprot:UN01320